MPTKFICAHCGEHMVDAESALAHLVCSPDGCITLGVAWCTAVLPARCAEHRCSLIDDHVGPHLCPKCDTYWLGRGEDG